MQKADKRPEQPETAENLCVICFSNALELWSSSFQSVNNVFFSCIQEGSELPHVDSKGNKRRCESNRAIFCTSSHKSHIFKKGEFWAGEQHFLAC